LDPFNTRLYVELVDVFANAPIEMVTYESQF
jgi:hypothetical protein